MSIYKVTVIISFCDCEGKSETRRESRTRFFESLKEAIYFSRWGGEDGYNFEVVKRQIWEYTISSVREMQEKEREVITEVKTREKYWE